MLNAGSRVRCAWTQPTLPGQAPLEQVVSQYSLHIRSASASSLRTRKPVSAPLTSPAERPARPWTSVPRKLSLTANT
eukprot:2874807-Rhodomonas_salina.2